MVQFLNKFKKSKKSLQYELAAHKLYLSNATFGPSFVIQEESDEDGLNDETEGSSTEYSDESSSSDSLNRDSSPPRKVRRKKSFKDLGKRMKQIRLKNLLELTKGDDDEEKALLKKLKLKWNSERNLNEKFDMEIACLSLKKICNMSDDAYTKLRGKSH